ncbi:CDP-glycerol glycerophosphotransferase family protein [Rarobacter incanus]|uniref:CDP-glycerol:poly(Glycerophosphate) glycerophosphotransferase n=1 Tax=Rarobacter incanus TaxID=153494 RepID=A0A542SNL1_9MICO|nr:CDP-glycerol glycerophosphotransferase family protein [Rarobacter incanus]TQK76224.1 CDP-glycerol:poly(glycerophosphate) glycerophosphotransferase [Rarobacter incanus]
MLHIRPHQAEPESAPSPARQIVPLLAVLLTVVVGAGFGIYAVWLAAIGAPAQWVSACGPLLLLAGVALNIYGTERETGGVTQLASFSANALTGFAAAQMAGGSQRVAAAVLICVVLLLQVGGPAIVTASRRSTIWVRHLPGYKDSKNPVNWRDALLIIEWIAPLAGIGTLCTGSALWWLTGAALATALGLATAGHIAWTNLRLGRTQAQLIRSIRAYDPEFILYTARPDDASYQLAMWLPYFERTGKRFLIVARSVDAAEPIAAMTAAPVLQLRTQRSLEWVLTPSMGAAFYVNASSGNNAFVRHPGVAHVYIGHGDSDKPPSYNPTHAMYDRVFAAGEGAIDRYAAHGVSIPRDKFVIVGRPQATDIDVVSGPGMPAGKRPTVLYAPTWRGHVGATAFQSLHLGEGIVRALIARDVNVLFRPHPFSYEFPEDAATIARIHEILASDQQSSERKHTFGAPAEKHLNAIECMNESDAMISDVSSVVSDYLYSGKPFAMVAISEPPDAFARTYPIAQGAYVIDDALTNIDDVLTHMLGTDEKFAARWQTRSYYLGDFPAETYDQVFPQAVIDAIALGVAKQNSAAPDDLDSDASDSPDQGADDEDEAAASGATTAVGRLLLMARGGLRLTVMRNFLRQILPVTIASASVVHPSWLWSAAATVFVLGGLIEVARRHRTRSVPLRTLYGTQAASWLAIALSFSLALPGDVALRADKFFAFPALALVVACAAFLVDFRGAVASGLPGLRVPATSGPLIVALAGITTLVAYLVALVTLAVGALSSSGLPPTLVGILVVLAALANASVFGYGIVQAWRSATDRVQLHDLVESYGPQFAVYFGATTGADYQYGMWANYFDRIDRKYVVVTRSERMRQLIASMTSAPVVLSPTLRSLDDVDAASLSTVFYVNNAVRNTHMVERAQLVNVWLNHGDSEKPACFNPVHAIYSYIFAAGQAGIDRYARHGVSIPRDKFKIVGRPQVENIEPVRAERDESLPRTVLYAPTWIGPYSDTDVYSLPVAAALIERLLQRNVRVIFRAHPLNYTKPVACGLIEDVQEVLARDAGETGREHLWGRTAESDMSIVDCFNASDAMICDISAVISDYLQSVKPFAVMAMGASREELLAKVPAAQSGYVVDGSLNNLDEILDQLLGPDPLASDRVAMRKYYLGDYPPENYANHFLDEARRLIDAGRRP